MRAQTPPAQQQPPVLTPSANAALAEAVQAGLAQMLATLDAAGVSECPPQVQAAKAFRHPHACMRDQMPSVSTAVLDLCPMAARGRGMQRPLQQRKAAAFEQPNLDPSPLRRCWSWPS